MGEILGLLVLILFVGLIVGLIKPSLVLRWSKKPNRLKVVGYWFLGFIIISILGGVFVDNKIESKSKLESANKYIEKGRYPKAISVLKKIKETDSLYTVAQQLIKKADSLNRLSIEQKRVAEELKAEEARTDSLYRTAQQLIKKGDSLNRLSIQQKRVAEELKAEEARKKELLKQKEELERELNSIKKGIDFANGNSIQDLQIDIALFSVWAKIIQEAKASKDIEINNLGEKLRSKVSKIQAREFPNLRSQYVKIVANKMWENDIEVYASGTGKRYINFTGGIFAANKNKKDFQNQLHKVLTMFRFKQSRYRWYKGEREYTYWAIYKGKDSDPVTF